MFPMPSRGFMDIDQRIDLISALNQLSPRQRRVLILWAAGYTHKEIAKEYGLTRRRIGQICAESISLLGELSHYVIEDT